MLARAANLIRELRAPPGPLISIIVPVRNAAAILQATLDSVAAAGPIDGTRNELLVIDGASTDGTLDLVRKHPTAPRWISEPDHGVYDAMNKGIGLARGRHLFFLGAGDRLRPGVLDRIAQFLPLNTLSFIYGNAFMADKGIVWDGPWTPEKFRTRNICHQAIFYGRAVFRLLGGFDIRYPILADYAMNMRCFAERRVRKRFVNEVISDYAGGGLSMKVHDDAFYAARPALLRRLFGIGSEKK